MMNAMNTDMLEAARLTRAGHLHEATALIQRSLRGLPGTEPQTPRASAPTPQSDGLVIEGEVRVVDMESAAGNATDTAQARTEPRSPFTSGPSKARAATDQEGAAAWSPDSSREFQKLWRELRGKLPRPLQKRAPEPLPEGAQFITGSYSNQAGTRSYKLYVPSGYHGQALPLVVMLHGCTQDPDDFAAGTRMNELAEKQGFLVAYPAQTQAANSSKCWNWFRAGDQQRNLGEPSIIAGLTRQVGNTYAVDPRRIFVAGLSAGAAMALTVAMTHPDLFAAVGIHSGLPHAVACDLPSALAQMSQGGATALAARSGKPDAGALPVPAIVFHGDRDTTVHPGNGDQVIAQCARPASRQSTPGAAGSAIKVESGQVSGGHAYTRTLYSEASGDCVAEHWLIHGAAHAWAGGSLKGSYTDPKGPDAAQQMLRFFLEHPRPEVASASV